MLTIQTSISKAFKSRAAQVWTAAMLISTMAWANPLVLGRWVSVQNLGDMKYSLALQVKEAQSSLAVTCSQGGKSVTAQIAVPTRLTDKKLIVLQGASESKKLGNIECTVELPPMEFSYRLQGSNKLILNAQGQSLVFERVNASILDELRVEDPF